MDTNQIAPASKPSLETETCSRCLGSGKFSYCTMYGDTCFKCGGATKVLTKRGQAANAYLNLLRSKRADAIVVGDAIYQHGPCVKTGFHTVLSIVNYPPNGTTTINEVVVPNRTDLLRFTCKLVDVCGVAPETMVRVRSTLEHSLATFAQAMEYQASLTKQGLPRKK